MVNVVLYKIEKKVSTSWHLGKCATFTEYIILATNARMQVVMLQQGYML